jgi:hypothetical protein
LGSPRPARSTERMTKNLADPGRREPTGMCELANGGACTEGPDHRRFAITQPLAHT